MDGAKIIQRGDQLFERRAPLLSLWQDMADNFYVERATFTQTRSIGTGFADHLMTGYPPRMRKELADAIASMLRPAGRSWFNISLGDVDGVPRDVLVILDQMRKIQYRAMYDRVAFFTRATKEADNDYATFGNAVISVDKIDESRLLYRCWHLRDCAWAEDHTGAICELHRCWKLTVDDLISLFGSQVPEELRARSAELRREEVECRHVVMKASRYEGKTNREWVSLYVLKGYGDKVLETVGRDYFGYVVPRWQTVSDSQYGYSPAVVSALPDARMMQDMVRTLIEAGEKAVDPPMLAVQEAIRGDISVFPGGVTWVDAEYDERLGEVLRPMTQDKSGLPFGMEMNNQVQMQMAATFMLNKLTLPEARSGVTAFEISQRVQEYIRQAMPLFEPVEQEYNGALCEETFRVIRSMNGFGPLERMLPPEMMRSVKFQFTSPFTSAEDREAVAQYQEVLGMVSQHAALDPQVVAEIDATSMFRDAVRGTGAAPYWLASEQAAAQKRQMIAQQQQMAQMVQMAAAGGEAAKSVGEGGNAIAEMMGGGAE